MVYFWGFSFFFFHVVEENIHVLFSYICVMGLHKVYASKSRECTEKYESKEHIGVALKRCRQSYIGVTPVK